MYDLWVTHDNGNLTPTTIISPVPSSAITPTPSRTSTPTPFITIKPTITTKMPTIVITKAPTATRTPTVSKTPTPTKKPTITNAPTMTVAPTIPANLGTITNIRIASPKDSLVQLVWDAYPNKAFYKILYSRSTPNNFKESQESGDEYEEFDLSSCYRYYFKVTAYNNSKQLIATSGISEVVVSIGNPIHLCKTIK